MKRWTIVTLLATLLGACVVTPVDYRYRDDGYYARHGYYYHDRYSYRGPYRYDYHSYYYDHGK